MADVILPDLGESVTEGIIIRWMKGVGDTVERDEPLYEVSTDKVDSEVPSPVAGVLVEIVVPEGDTVAVGGTVAVIGDAGQVAAAAPALSTSAQEAPAAEAASGSPARSTQAPQHAGQGSGQVTSPFVRRAIEQRGLEAGSIHGSGPGGRITRLDVANATVTRPLVALGSIDRGSPTGFVALEATFDAHGEAPCRLQLGTRLVGLAEGRKLNASYRGKDYATNVLTFVYDTLPDGATSADLVICVPVLAREAREQHKAFLSHAAHLVVHGTLHALGYDHLKPRDAHRMESLETQILAAIGIDDPYVIQDTLLQADRLS